MEKLEVLFEEVSQPDQVSLQVDASQADLLLRYKQALMETLFENRAQIRPAMLGSVAAREVEALTSYFQHPSSDIALQRGVQLCQVGIGEQTLLRLGQTNRQFLLAHLGSDLFTTALETVDAYQSTVLLGFMQTRGRIVLEEQANIRSALLRALNRSTIQMDLASGVALAINSNFNLEALLNTTVELIRDRFTLFYVGVFLLADDNRGLTLAARSEIAQKEQEVLPASHDFEVGDSSLIGQCVVDGKPKIILNLTTTSAWYPPGSRSAIAIPLLARGKVLGVLAGYSQNSAAFSDQDAAALRILGDQLANAIENSRLYSELQHSEEKYRTILDTIEEGYYEMDLDGNFTFVNGTACAILGYAKAEIENVDYRHFIVPEYTSKLEKAFERVRLTGNSAQNIEHQVIKKDGTARTVEIYISFTQNLAGQVAGFRGILRDITRRKEAEQFVIERKALERSNQDLEQFAYVASHDLQEPLRKIQAFGDRLKTISAGSLDSDGLDCLDRMVKSANRMGILINDILNLSRVKTQAQPFVPVDLNLVLQQVLSDLEGQIKSTGGSIEATDLSTISADALQMQQLLQNLIGNSLKFHKPGVPPVIKVSSQIIEERRDLRSLGSDKVCQIMVADNGIGFDEKYLERIFLPFERLHTRKEYEGTGIGLSICRSIVERHHGHITAHSVKGQGATFTVTLPTENKHDWENHE